METVDIQVSPAQRSKLRNGKRVIIKKPKIQGEGFKLLVKPHRLNPISKAFDRDHGVSITLDSDEIQANKEMEGKGIFGRQASRAMKNLTKDVLGKKDGQKLSKAVHSVGKQVLLPVAKGALDVSAAAAAPALMSMGVPAPVAIAAPMAASNIAKGYLSDPKAYQKKGGEKQALEDMDIGKVASKTAMGTIKEQKKAKAKGGKVKIMKPAVMPKEIEGEGLYGRGLYASVQGRGTLMSHSVGGHPALQSQAVSAHFHMANQMSPALAKLIRG
jgi:hypothetical protein